MTDNPAMKLWTAIVTAFLALCTALGLITTTATTAAAVAEPARSAESFGAAQEPARPTASSPTWLWSQARSLPPTMKQRIRAEAHGKSPSCRHHGLPDTEAAERTTSCTPEDPAEPVAPQQS